MGLMDGMLGRAAESDPARVEKELARVLVEGERVERGYTLARDRYVFTDRRLILVDRQGVSSRKMEYHSLPYRSITHFSVETAGTFDRDAELKLWISGGTLIRKSFNRNVDVLELQRVLASYVT